MSFWGSDKLEIRCGRENQHPERLGPQAHSWASQENGKETLMAIRVGVNMLQFCSVSNSLSLTSLSIKWEVYFSKEVSSLVLLCRWMHEFTYTLVLLHNSHNLTKDICLHTVCSIWTINRRLSCTTTPEQSGPKSNGIEGVLHIPQIFKAGASLSDGLLSYPGHSLGMGCLTPL